MDLGFFVNFHNCFSMICDFEGRFADTQAFLVVFTILNEFSGDSWSFEHIRF